MNNVNCLGNFFQRGGIQGTFRQNYNRPGQDWGRLRRDRVEQTRAY